MLRPSEHEGFALPPPREAAFSRTRFVLPQQPDH